MSTVAVTSDEPDRNDVTNEITNDVTNESDTAAAVAETLETIKAELERTANDDNDVANESSESKINDCPSESNSAPKSDVIIQRPPHIPPHLMGRDLNNPAQDVIGTGRRVQKPRLGVKVPYRNLTSQIVTQDEIAQEILERSLRKYSYSDAPEGGDVFFAMKLTHRLANKISASENIEKKLDAAKAMIASASSTSFDTQNRNQKSADNESTGIDQSDEPSTTSTVIEQPNTATSLAVEKTEDSIAEELYAEISSSISEDCKTILPISTPSEMQLTDAEVKSQIPKIMNGSASAKIETELDNDTLLAILEGTSDLNENCVPPVAPMPVVEETVKKRKKRMKPFLDPDIEKELALKQLMDFETKKRQKKLERVANRIKVTSPRNGVVPDTTNTAPPPVDESVIKDVQKKVKRNTTCVVSSQAPKRFPKKYQRIIKRQLRSSKLKTKNASPEQQKKLPEVPEVQIAIDRYIKTYASKRKHKPDSQTCEKPAEKKLKTNVETSVVENVAASVKQPAAMPADAAPTATTPVPAESVESNEKHDSVANIATAAAEVAEKENDEAIVKSKANSKVMREINRLLGDEGAINMIYSIEQKRLPDSKRDANILPSARRKKKDLQLRTKLVKNAVLRLSMSSSQSTPTRIVRRASPEVTPETSSASAATAATATKIASATAAVTKNASMATRKASIESVESNSSEHNASSTAPKTRKIAAEASRIIRRHSSSSAYSSDDDEDVKKGGKLEQSSKGAVVAGEVKATTVAAGAHDSIPCPAQIEDNNNNNNRNNNISNSNNNECVPTNANVQIAEKDVKKSSENTKVNSPASSRRTSKETAPTPIDETRLHTEAPVNGFSKEVSDQQLSLKEITVRKYDNLVQIILISSSTKMKNALNIDILRELISVLRELQKDDSCRTVLVTSTGSSFCQGIDLQTLICADKTERVKVVNEFVHTLVSFTKCLSQFRKVLIAGVHGSAVGLGVTMLPFFDMVFASDKATFYTPYVKLGQIPEAGATLTLPHLLGNAVTSELLFGCRMLTASEALQFGLVTRILWPDKFTEELLPLARGIASHSPQAMEATKLLIRHGMTAKLEEQLETEANLLREHWCSDECQSKFKEYLEREALIQNKI